MIRTSTVSLCCVPLLFACSAATERTTKDSGVEMPGAGGGLGNAGMSSGTPPLGSTGSAGSGNALNVGPDTHPAPGDLTNGECARQTFQLSRQPAEILLLLDRSGSMKEKPSGSSASDSKWSLVVPAVNEVVTATNATISWGLKAFPEGEGEECIAESVTAAVPVTIAPNNAAAVTAQLMALTPEGNGTPTGDAVEAAVKYLKSLTDPNPKFILLATDGEPS
ncbi:MAG TPA: vWA domain-containing protein, partial [Polyangiaceae bacterium]|nr:vWA domain-containing protein [Polyangiaceae bacterium]